MAAPYAVAMAVAASVGADTATSSERLKPPRTHPCAPPRGSHAPLPLTRTPAGDEELHIITAAEASQPLAVDGRMRGRSAVA